MLIGFAGSSGSGKTALVNAIAEKIKCGVVREVARDIFNDWKHRYGFESLAELSYSPSIPESEYSSYLIFLNFWPCFIIFGISPPQYNLSQPALQ